MLSVDENQFAPLGELRRDLTVDDQTETHKKLSPVATAPGEQFFATHRAKIQGELTSAEKPNTQRLLNPLSTHGSELGKTYD